MLVKSLDLKNFRNHASKSLCFDNGVNILVGANARGKTNILESIYLSCVGKGFRSSRDKEMIKFDCTHSRVKILANKKFGDISVEVTLLAHDKKQVKINDVPILKMGELMGSVTCVLFCPDELRLIKEAPSDRRRFMDIHLSQLDKNYFYSLIKYNKTLLQRNALLKTLKPDSDLRSLDIWDEQLVKSALYIIERRLKFVESLKTQAKHAHSLLTDSAETLSIEYGLDSNYIEEDALKAALLKARDKDLRLGNTSVGPHRDDLLIQINGKDVRHFASQGQQRTAALSLKLAELEIFKDLTQEAPILLLDDVLSELDANRQRALIHAIKDTQTIITATKIDELLLDIPLKVFEI